MVKYEISMSRQHTGSILAAALFFLVCHVYAETPNLGVPASGELVNELDITVLPNGDGLPPGSGNAVVGEKLYMQHCLACHGESGQGGLNNNLVGGHGSLSSNKPAKTVGSFWPYSTTIFDYIRRAMPYTIPGSLGNDDVYALTAYILYLNGIIREKEEMNARTLPEVAMPNRDNFRQMFKAQ